MKVLGVDNIFVPVGDLDEAVAFYRDTLGLPVAARFEEMGAVLFQLGEEAPGLIVTVTQVPPAPAHKVWLEVADARAAAEGLTAAGVRSLTAPFLIPTGWAFEVSDPWSNVIGFTDYVERPELGRPRRETVIAGIDSQQPKKASPELRRGRPPGGVVHGERD